MSDKLREVIDRELTAFVDKLIAEAVARGDDEIPVVGGPWYENDPDFDARQHLVRALLCREWFKTQCPEWGQPLPLSRAEYSDMCQRHDFPDLRLYLVASFSNHLRGDDWHYERVGPFCLWCLEYGRAMERPTGARNRR